MPCTFQGQPKNIKLMQATEHSNLINEKLLKQVREQILPKVFWNMYKTLDITSFARPVSGVSAESKPL